MGIRFQGLKRYQRRMSQAPKKIEREQAAAVKEVGKQLHSSVRSKAPVDTGELRSKTILTPIRRRGKLKAIEVVGRAEHASILNYGSRYVRATWYFTRAVREIQEVARARFGKVFRVV